VEYATSTKSTTAPRVQKWAKSSIMILALGSVKKAADTAINPLIAVSVVESFVALSAARRGESSHLIPPEAPDRQGLLFFLRFPR
jgi:hypothetical protein